MLPCRHGMPHGIRESQLLVPPDRGFRVSCISNPEPRSRTPYVFVFPRSRRERTSCAGPRGPQHHRAVRNSEPRPHRCPRRRRHPRRVSDRLRQDARFRDSDRRADRRRRRPAGRARPRPHPRARLAGRRGHPPDGRRQGAADRSRLRRHLDRAAGQAGPGGTDPRRHTGPAVRPDRAAPDLALRGARARPRRGRPDARHGLPAAGRQDPSGRSREPADDAVLRDARGAGPGTGAAVHVQPVPLPRRSAGRGEAGRRRPRLRPGHTRGQARSGSSSNSTASAASHSSSSARSTAPTSSPESSRTSTTSVPR